MTQPRFFKTISTTLCAALFLTACGCGTTSTSSTPPPSYGREGPAIALARQGREREEARQAEQRAAQRSADIAAAAAAMQTKPAAAPVPAPAPAAVGQIKHVVIMWLKKPGDAAGRAAILDARQTIKTIPGVVDVAAGECLPSDRKVVDSSYDIALVVTLANAEALKGYAPHPIHQKLLEEVVKPNVERYVVYDFLEK